MENNKDHDDTRKEEVGREEMVQIRLLLSMDPRTWFPCGRQFSNSEKQKATKVESSEKHKFPPPRR